MAAVATLPEEQRVQTLAHVFDATGTPRPSAVAAPAAASTATPVETASAALLAAAKGADTQSLRGVKAGVCVGWLKRFAAREDCAGRTTLDVVLKIIKPETEARKCRYVALIAEQEAGSVGRAKFFVSHTWRAPFRDLVAAIAFVLGDDAIVWLDVFAVLQWNAEDGLSEAQVQEKVEDLDFAAVVKATDALLLVGQHVPEVAEMSIADALAHKTPEVAKLTCAFYRVWCASRGPIAALVPHPLSPRVCAGAWWSWRRRCARASPSSCSWARRTRRAPLCRIRRC